VIVTSLTAMGTQLKTFFTSVVTGLG